MIINLRNNTVNLVHVSLYPWKKKSFSNKSQHLCSPAPLAGDSLRSVCDECGIHNWIECHEWILWSQNQPMNLLAMWHPHAWTYTLWHQDSAGSHKCLVDSKESRGVWGGGGLACSSPPFPRLHGNQCNFRGVIEQTAESTTPKRSPEYSGKGKISYMLNNIPK